MALFRAKASSLAFLIVAASEAGGNVVSSAASGSLLSLRVGDLGDGADATATGAGAACGIAAAGSETEFFGDGAGLVPFSNDNDFASMHLLH